MSVLDVFKDDMFGMVSLTTALMKLPYVPSRLGALGLFAKEGINTLSAVIEEEHGKLSLIKTAARGSNPNVMGGTSRKARSFRVPHIPLLATVYADDVQGVRAFGSESETETVAAVVNKKLARMKQDFEVTKEYHRIGAIRGIVLDGDGSTVLYNWFDEFNISEHEVDFDFEEDNSVKLGAAEVTRWIQDVLGMTPYRNIRAECGAGFYDALTTCDEVKEAFERWQSQGQMGQFLRDSQVRSAFDYAGITWEEYRGSVGNTAFIADDECRFFPEGTTDIFQEIMAPADYVETVNTIGQEFYAKQELMKFGKGVEIEGQTNPLMICTRPSVLVKGVDDTSGS